MRFDQQVLKFHRQLLQILFRRHLRGLLPGADFTHAHALATHPRIAQAARETGFGVVHESPPRLDDVVASIKSLT